MSTHCARSSTPPRRRAAEHLDRFLRAKAEADNTRKRTEQEIANSRKYAVESFAGEMLTVHDSLDLARSVSLVDSAVAVEKMHEGLELTLKLMNDVLAKFGRHPDRPKRGEVRSRPAPGPEYW